MTLRHPALLGAIAIILAGAAAQAATLQDAVQDLRAGRFEAALEKLDILAADSRDSRILTLRGMALAGAGRARESLAAYDEALRHQPRYLPALQGAAELEFQTNGPTARHRLERVLAVEPANKTAHAMLGSLSHRGRDCAEAVKHFEASGAAAFADPVVSKQYAECLYLVGRYAAAAKAFQRLTALFPADRNLQYNLGLALHDAGKHADAVRVLEPVSSEISPDADALSLLAEAQRDALDIPGAVSTLQRAVRNFPRIERFYLQLAELCMEHGNFDLGLEVVEAGSRNLRDSARLHTMRGVLQAQLGFYDKAEAAFQRAADLEPDERSAVLGLSITLQRTGRAQDSIEVLRSRLGAAPSDAVTAYLLAQALVRKGLAPSDEEFVEARELLERAVEALPKEAAPRVELGKLLLREGQVDEAIAVLREAVAMEPADRIGVYQLMIALRRGGQPEEAFALARRVRQQLQEAKTEEVRRNRFRLVAAEADVQAR